LRCTKAASVMEACLHQSMFKAWTPFKWVKAASVMAGWVQSAMLRV
jgi:hypothetical protein